MKTYNNLINVLAASRPSARDTGSCKDSDLLVEWKKSNLHENRKLRDVDAYKTVFIRSSKLFITKINHLLTIIHLLSANSIKFQLKELYDMR